MAFIAICGNREMVGRYCVAGFASRVYVAVFVAGMAFFAAQVCMHAEKLEIRMGLVAQVTPGGCNNTRLTCLVMDKIVVAVGA